MLKVIMSLHNTNHLMSSMLSRASGITFDTTSLSSRPQFNPATGSWVFGLAAFAAGVAVNKMIKPGGQRSAVKSNKSRSNSHSRMDSDAFRESHMHSLLRDTMEEESRSGEYVENISLEVAKLREEIAALCAQKDQYRLESPLIAREPNMADASLEQEFNEVRAKLGQINEEKSRLSRTEQELKQVLATKRNESSYTELADGKLSEIQQELNRLKSEQSRIQAEYEFSRDDATKAHSEMERLEHRLQDKVSKLREAELREQALKRDYQVLMETVESLKTQLDFFRNKASQDKSGVTSLKILEESNAKLKDQVSSSLHQTEQQQAALMRLTAEKSNLAKQLEEYRQQAMRSEERMDSLEKALLEAKNAEKVLLEEIEKLSQQQAESASDSEARVRLERELESARVSIENLEKKERELLDKLNVAEDTISSNESPPIVNQLTSERDELKRALDSKEQNLKELEASYREKVNDAARIQGDATTELVVAAEKQEELNHKITGLLGKVKSLEDERDFLKSQSEKSNLEATNAGNEFMALMQSIGILEDEKRSLSVELDRYKSNAKTAEMKLAETQRRLDLSVSEEREYSDQITTLKSSINEHKKLAEDFVSQQNELKTAQEHIQGLIESHQNKDKELEVAKRELNTIENQLAELSQRSSVLEGIERDAANKVAGIQAELSKKDQVIANSKIQEDSLKREIDMLMQTTASMESEIKRLNVMQAQLGSSSASLSLLKETEQQLREQINHANNAIEKQHSQLLDAERVKIELEHNQREESLKLSAIQSENSSLKQKLQELEKSERNTQNLVSEIDRDQAYFKSLERESELLKQRQNELQQQVEQFKANEDQLQSELQNTKAELANVIKQRDAIKHELDSVRNELNVVSAEKDNLQETCEGLQVTIQELESKKDETAKFAKAVVPESVIPLTVKDTVSSDTIELADELDITVFEESAKNTEKFSTPVTEQLFQTSNKNARLRKFKGHRKIEDIAAKESELDNKIKEDLELSQAREMSGFVMESSEKVDKLEKVDKKKAYSPNRSFSDLLDENERRKVETTPKDPEKQWDELDAQLDEDLVEEEKGSLKPLFYGSIAAGLLIGAPLTYLYYTAKDGGDSGQQPDSIADSTGGATGTQSNVPSSNNNSIIPDNGSESDSVIDLSSTETNDKVLTLLQEFHDAKDFKSRSKLCRLPNRTLKDMKLYALSNKQDHTVEKVELQPQPLKRNGLTFIVAAVEGKLDGATFTKDAYFMQNDKGELLLDWHNYVNYESAPWDKFLNFDDNKESQDWHVVLKPEANDHDDFPPEKFGSFKVNSWNPDSYGSAYVYLSIEDPMYDQLMDAYNKDKQKKFILRLKHTGDGSLALIVEEVISLSEFYLTDIDSTVSSSIDELSFGDTSY